jgi:hypothetical membrane protein
MLTFGALELLFLVQLAETLYPGYSISQNVISDLGVGPEPSRWIFEGSLILFGGLVILFVYLRGGRTDLLKVLTVLAGVGAIGVALFNENLRGVHLVFAGLAFGTACLAALMSSRKVRGPISMVFAALGIIGLVALVLQGMKTYLGLGEGGMERMIFYPALFWALLYGVYNLTMEDRDLEPRHA